MAEGSGGQGQQAGGEGIGLRDEPLSGLYVFLAMLNAYQVARADELPAGAASAVMSAVQTELSARWKGSLATGEVSFAPVMRQREIEGTVQAFRHIAAGLMVPAEEIETESDPAMRRFLAASDAAGRLAERIAELAEQSHPARAVQ